MLCICKTIGEGESYGGGDSQFISFIYCQVLFLWVVFLNVSLELYALSIKQTKYLSYRHQSPEMAYRVDERQQVPRVDSEDREKGMMTP